jgi:hypothetical protein
MSNPLGIYNIKKLLLELSNRLKADGNFIVESTDLKYRQTAGDEPDHCIALKVMHGEKTLFDIEVDEEGFFCEGVLKSEISKSIQNDKIDRTVEIFKEHIGM